MVCVKTSILKSRQKSGLFCLTIQLRWEAVYVILRICLKPIKMYNIHMHLLDLTEDIMRYVHVKIKYLMRL
jgi:hypothetical protein